MAASDRAMLHALTAPATGKTATAPTTSTMAATDAAPLSWSGCATVKRTRAEGRLGNKKERKRHRIGARQHRDAPLAGNH